ncbi:type II secretion system F family protein [Cohnella zeiphila]|uniref:Type II secretion system F family protein n=1 Tax=Cohnella zeiphila TaxID=2761120 RepID=A0A7X0SNG2_9BACL|nr:type II secretion system F family protein [Cohnella zeiphila]MBB6730968.1 type II secretion system F family protein [Cohnella zeiphila]
MRTAIVAAWAAVLLAYGIGLAAAWRKRESRTGKFHFLYDPVRAMIEGESVYRRIEPWLERPRSALAVLNGGACTKDQLLRWAAEAGGSSLAVLLASGPLSIAADSREMALLGLMVAPLLPVLRYKDLMKKVDSRRRQIVLELPELLSRLLLMVNAGENVMRALEKCLQRQESGRIAPKSHPLYAELRHALEAVRRGEPLVVALEEFGRRSAVPEAKMFATTLLINSRRGGETFVSALRELARTLWERRKAVTRTLGEQASSKMVFPMVVIFLLILVLVGTPSMLMMSQ